MKALCAMHLWADGSTSCLCVEYDLERLLRWAAAAKRREGPAAWHFWIEAARAPAHRLGPDAKAMRAGGAA